MTLIADFMLLAGALGAAFYCMVLSRRLRRLSRLDDGMGAAIAVLSRQVDQMTRALDETREAARQSADDLAARTARADAAIARIELLMAALNDVPQATAAPAAPDPHAGRSRAQTVAPDRSENPMSPEDAL